MAICTMLKNGTKAKAENEQPRHKAGTFIDEPLYLGLNVEPQAAVERYKELVYGVLQRVAQGPVKEAAQRHKQEEVNKAAR